MIFKIQYKPVNFKRILLHILFWLILHCYITLIYILSQEGRVFNVSSVIETLFGSILLIPATYLIIYYLLPKLAVQQKKYALFLILYLIIMFVATIADPLVYTYIYIPNFRPEVLELYKAYSFKPTFIIRLFYSKNIEFILFFSAKFLIEYLKGYYAKSKIKTEILNTELKMLQSQLHPHFLFNTLNNIYSLLLDNNKELVSDTILKISNILNYSIKECKSNIISLEKELKIINDYIELERLRHSNIEIITELPEDVQNIKVLPLSLFTLVENAFKHGINKSIKNKSIKVNLNKTELYIQFVVINSKLQSKQKDDYGSSQGIGLKNLRSRMDLYIGNGNYKLNTLETDKYYKAELICKV